MNTKPYLRNDQINHLRECAKLLDLYAGNPNISKGITQIIDSINEPEPKYEPLGDTGFHQKFHVSRVDGQSAPGERHDGCAYFVLDLDHDPFSVAAMLVYGVACKETQPELAETIFARYPTQKMPIPVVNWLIDMMQPFHQHLRARQNYEGFLAMNGLKEKAPKP